MHVVLELHAFERRTGKRRFVLDIAGLALRFGDIHRHVGIANQVIGRFLSRHQTRDADTGVHREFLAADREGRRELPGDPVGDSVGDLLILHISQEHRELITAEPGHGIPRTKRRGDPSPDGHQQLVAHLVAERVVDRLEIIQVEEENGNPAFRVRAQRVIEVDPEGGPIGQVGERVMERLMGQLLLEGLTLAHVSHVQDEAAHGR